MSLLKIALWNANGLSQHKLEVQAFLKEQNIDIMLVSETHFTNKSFFNIKNYTIYDTKQPNGKACGGTAVLIKRGIRHYELPKYKEEYIQATTIALEEWSGKCNISAIYCPPKHAIKQEQFSNYFKSLGPKFLAGGDFNAKHVQWGSRLTTTKGKELWNTIRDNSLSHASTGQPTYWPTDRSKIPDLIDFCVTKNINASYISVESSFDLSSDHSPVIITLSTKALKIPSTPKLTSKKTNWQAYKDNFVNNCVGGLPLKNEDDIDFAVETLTATMTVAAIQSTPKVQQIEREATTSKSIRDLITEKRRLRKRFQQTRSPADKAILNRAIKNLKTALEKDRDEGLQYYLERLTPTEATDYSLWKATKKLKSPQAAQHPIRRNNGNWARSDKEKSNLFASHLADVFSPYPQLIDTELPQITDEPDTSKIATFRITEVKKIFSEINPKKAPGFDLITGKMVQELPAAGVKLFLHIINASIKMGYFPKKWKIAQIVMIPKPGKDETQVASYRPISLLPILAKLFEKLILNKLKPILIQKN